ncbi:PucR family transcriptional regulator [Aeromicrobium sp. CTD01-1L150]|uniref:PucR family transcriptional regulator n=1 Tax=Aeromicrobium sp. CTD01-1L150 TaxID=3341830 RepID=UPI0035BF24DA
MSVKSAEQSDTDRVEGEGHAEEIIREVLTRRRHFVDTLTTYTGHEIAELVADESTAHLLGASISENTLLLIQTLYEGQDPATVTAPPGAVQYARKLAQNDVSMASLMRAYRFGQAQFTEMCLGVAQELGDRHGISVLSDIVSKVAIFIDRICDVVAREYEQERERWVRSRSGMRQHWINELLAGDVTDINQAEAALGYPLHGRHLAVELWAEDSITQADGLQAFDLVAGVIGKSLGHRCPSMLVATGQREARAWFAPRADERPSVDVVGRWLRDQRVPVRVALSTTLSGIEGFCRSSRQASRTKELAASNPSRKVVEFGEVAAVAMLRDDPAELQDFVRRVLGGLAEPGERNDGLRETLLVFLELSGDHTLASQRLHVHRNTVRYRVEQALQAIGADSPRHVSSHDTMLALSILRWRQNLFTGHGGTSQTCS